MDDIRRQDRKLFIRELFRPGCVFGYVLGLAFIGGGLSLISSRSPFGAEPAGLLFGAIGLAVLFSSISNAHRTAVSKRFSDKRFRTLWESCQDRLGRFEEVLGKMRREQIADLQEMPKTIRRVSESLYGALRRADLIANEVAKTEKDVFSAPPTWQALSQDAQAKELYRIADKNIAEYRMQFAGLMAGVHRAEAQSAVFMTTLDSLRMKMLGYRLVGTTPEMSSMEFLDAMTEAKLQLNAIDQALEELDFTQFPKMIAAVPPPPPEVRHMNQGS